jgi:hypothetical protein
MFSSLMAFSPLRCGCGKEKLTFFSSEVGASTSSMRSICFNLACACEALLALARKRSANSCNRAISRCWLL